LENLTDFSHYFHKTKILILKIHHRAKPYMYINISKYLRLNLSYLSRVGVEKTSLEKATGFNLKKNRKKNPGILKKKRVFHGFLVGFSIFIRILVKPKIPGKNQKNPKNQLPMFFS
jgi:hypothetical protein